MFKVAVLVDKGLYKANNEDRALVNDHIYDEILFDAELPEGDVLLAVADGVGGENAGEVAAEETLRHMAELYPLADVDYEETLNRVIEECSERLIKLAESNPECEGMATTLTGLVIYRGSIMTFNLGNSRVYRCRNGMLRQLTRDHSIVQELVDAGLLDNSSRDDAAEKNVITKYVGSNGKRFPASITAHDIVLQTGDIFFLCSDGIHDFVAIEEMEEILEQDMMLKDKAAKLSELAKANPGHDNISVILLEVLEGNEEADM